MTLPPRMKRAAYFIPLAGCRRRCVYCDQRRITGAHEMPDPAAIEARLAQEAEPVELCYFGGSFGSLPPAVAVSYLDAVNAAPAGSRVTFSTYPADFLGERGDHLIELLSRYPIGTVELGVPSLDASVLRASNRGDDPGAVLSAIARARDAGHHIGVQIMTGLPSQTEESSRRDLEALSALMPRGGSWHIRIYPCLVLEGTELEAAYRRGEYAPQTLGDAVSLAASLTRLAVSLGFSPIRVGLQDSLSLRASVIAGPYHPAFGELVMSDILASRLAESSPCGPWNVPRNRASLMTGHGALGIKKLAALTGLSPDETRRNLIFF